MVARGLVPVNTSLKGVAELSLRVFDEIGSGVLPKGRHEVFRKRRACQATFSEISKNLLTLTIKIGKYL